MPLEVFYSYAHEDEKLRNELDKHLRLLQRQNLIFGWHDRRIGAGTMWGDQIDEHIHSAHIILLLISPDFIASQYCYDQEMAVALARHSRREALVIPIILRPVNWKGAPFGHLQALPRDTKPVTTWANQDEAFAAIADEIREVVLEFQSRIPAPIPAPVKSPAIPASQEGPKERMLDAAIASHIVKGEPTDLLVLIRLPDSPGLRGVLAAEQDSDARPEDVLSKKFSVTFPRGFDGDLRDLKVAVEITSPDFLPPRQSKNILVPPDADSDICGFILTPTRVGSLKVLVELQWEDVMRGQRRLITECLAEAVPQPKHGVMNVVHMPIAVEMAPVRSFGHNVPDPAPPQTGPIRIRGPINVSGSDDEPPDTMPPPISPPQRAPEAAEKASRRTEDDKERWEYASSPTYSSAPTVGLPPPPPPVSAPRAAKRSSGVTRIILACIIAIPLILGAYWQFVYKPQKAAETSPLLVFSGHVLNARTSAFVPNARVMLSLINASGSARSYQKSTDSNGAFDFPLKDVKPGTRASVYVRADNFAPFEQDIVLAGSSAGAELRLKPIANPPAKITPAPR